MKPLQSDLDIFNKAKELISYSLHSIIDDDPLSNRLIECLSRSHASFVKKGKYKNANTFVDVLLPRIRETNNPKAYAFMHLIAPEHKDLVIFSKPINLEQFQAFSHEELEYIKQQDRPIDDVLLNNKYRATDIQSLVAKHYDFDTTKDLIFAYDTALGVTFYLNKVMDRYGNVYILPDDVVCSVAGALVLLHRAIFILTFHQICIFHPFIASVSKYRLLYATIAHTYNAPISDDDEQFSKSFTCVIHSAQKFGERLASECKLKIPTFLNIFDISEIIIENGMRPFYNVEELKLEGEEFEKEIQETEKAQEEEEEEMQELDELEANEILDDVIDIGAPLVRERNETENRTETNILQIAPSKKRARIQ